MVKKAGIIVDLTLSDDEEPTSSSQIQRPTVSNGLRRDPARSTKSSPRGGTESSRSRSGLETASNSTPTHGSPSHPSLYRGPGGKHSSFTGLKDGLSELPGNRPKFTAAAESRASKHPLEPEDRNGNTRPVKRPKTSGERISTFERGRQPYGSSGPRGPEPIDLVSPSPERSPTRPSERTEAISTASDNVAHGRQNLKAGGPASSRPTGSSKPLPAKLPLRRSSPDLRPDAKEARPTSRGIPAERPRNAEKSGSTKTTPCKAAAGSNVVQAHGAESPLQARRSVTSGNIDRTTTSKEHAANEHAKKKTLATPSKRTEQEIPESTHGPRISQQKQPDGGPPDTASGTPARAKERGPDGIRSGAVMQPSQRCSQHSKERASDRTADESEHTSQAASRPRTDGQTGSGRGPSTSAKITSASPVPISRTTIPQMPDLTPALQVEKILGKHIEEMQTDNEYWTSILLERASQSYDRAKKNKPVKETSGSSNPPVDWFAKLQPLKLTRLPKKPSSPRDGDAILLTDKTSSGSKAVVAWSLPCEKFSSDSPEVRNYSHFVGIKNNILAPNVTSLHVQPYFGDDPDPTEVEALKDQYESEHENREERLLYRQRADKYAPYAESALKDIECTWAAVLRYLIERGGKGSTQVDNFTPSSARALAILSTLPPSTPQKQMMVGHLCDNFLKMAKFDLWHVARSSKEAQLPSSEETSPTQANENDALTCAICLRHDCVIHGEIQERRGSDTDSDDANIVNLDINCRSRVSFPPPKTGQSSHVLEATERIRAITKKEDAHYWQQPKLYKGADKRSPFYPCHHPGKSCETAECLCFREGRPCEKICGCSPKCGRRFQGCSCAKQNQVCFNDANCQCYQNDRECDPDLCGVCGVCEVVDPLNKYNDEILSGRCRNAGIQRGVPKHTVLGDSEIHGLGLYACEDMQPHDFVGEYKGELITKEEAERRGAVYYLQNLSYLFSLNKEQEVDSTYFGNKVRFINHADQHAANLYPRIIVVNAVHRIALYARCKIVAGQELFFDYGPEFPHEQLGGTKENKSAPHVRNANLVKGFAKVEHHHDAGTGNTRAKAVGKKASSAPRGGARPGAGRKPHAAGEQMQRPVKAFDFEQDAGSRLARFNISDDGPNDLEEMEVDGGADDEYRDDSEEEEEEEYDSDASEERQESEEFESDDEEGTQTRISKRGKGVQTRFVAR